ncbi:MAG TPA: hypothetical protein VKP66_01020 [Steroidobacteraceae bacterium]|nr:hypothetical protein [Steroidobacteraceae bacterium]
MWSAVWEHFSPVFFMAFVVLGSQAFTRRAQHARSRGEARRLRTALIVGLAALRKLHVDNLSVLAGGAVPLMSGRHQINLVRPHLARLISLEESEIDAVMSAVIAAEKAESAMAIGGKALGGVAFSVPEEDDARARLRSAFTEACVMLETAEGSMCPGGAASGYAGHAADVSS